MLASLPSAAAQQKAVPLPMPVPMPGHRREVPEPASPPAQTVRDSRARLRFDLPAGWSLSRNDGELSTFHQDARTAPGNARLSAVAALAWNPFPATTFSGALFYVSTTPRSSPAACTAQAHGLPAHTLPDMSLHDVPFALGHEENGTICTQSRDVVYTTLRGRQCVRFDLTIHTFCGGEVSGAADMSDQELAAIFTRLQTVVRSVVFTD